MTTLGIAIQPEQRWTHEGVQTHVILTLISEELAEELEALRKRAAEKHLSTATILEALVSKSIVLLR